MTEDEVRRLAEAERELSAEKDKEQLDATVAAEADQLPPSLSPSATAKNV